jgi:pimeloyl-ACP methyl ester carboxylesterase
VTTVVPPHPLTGTAQGGAASALGTVERVPVVPVPLGQVLEPASPAGATGLSESVEVALRRFGSGPDLLLVCGQRCTMSSWDDSVLDALARSYSVVVFDPPGAGYSGPPLGRETVASQADLVAGIIDALGLTSTTLLGWGIGGEVALATAERHPRSVARLVLVEATAGGTDATLPSRTVTAALSSPDETADELSSLYFPPGDETARLAWLTEMSGPAPDDLVASAVAASAAFAAAAWADRSVSAGLGGLHLPVLLLAGSDDVVVPPRNSTRLAGALHTREVLLDGAGYASMAQELSTVVADLRRFSGLSPAGASGATRHP